MARGKRPVTFRTRKLSLSAPMVLPWRRGGRVGRRRTTLHGRAPATRPGPFRRFVTCCAPAVCSAPLLALFAGGLVEDLRVLVHAARWVGVAQRGLRRQLLHVLAGALAQVVVRAGHEVLRGSSGRCHRRRTRRASAYPWRRRAHPGA